VNKLPIYKHPIVVIKTKLWYKGNTETKIQMIKVQVYINTLTTFS